METTTIYLTDKNGKIMFKNCITKSFIDSGIRELQYHINNAKKYPNLYYFCDIETLQIKIEN